MAQVINGGFSTEPIYASQTLTIRDCEQLHEFMGVETPVSGDLTARINRLYPVGSAARSACEARDNVEVSLWCDECHHWHQSIADCQYNQED